MTVERVYESLLERVFELVLKTVILLFLLPLFLLPLFLLLKLVDPESSDLVSELVAGLSIDVPTELVVSELVAGLSIDVSTELASDMVSEVAGLFDLVSKFNLLNIFTIPLTIDFLFSSDL